MNNQLQIDFPEPKDKDKFYKSDFPNRIQKIEDLKPGDNFTKNLSSDYKRWYSERLYILDKIENDTVFFHDANYKYQSSIIHFLEFLIEKVITRNLQNEQI